MSFDEKYNRILLKIESLINDDYNPKNIKKFIDGYKIDSAIEKRNINKIMQDSNFNNNNNNSQIIEEKRKKIVGLKEIREHGLKFDKMKIKRIANNELKKMKMKEQENEYLLKMEKKFNVNMKKFSDIKNIYDEENEKKKLLIDKSLKVQKFSKLVNKFNFENIQKQKYLKNKFEMEFRNHSSEVGNRNKIKENLSPITKNNKEKNIKGDNINDINQSNEIKREKNFIKNEKKNQKYSLPYIFKIKKNNNILDNDKKLNLSNNKYDKENKYNIDIRKPLDIKPDYLHQKNLQIFPSSKKKIYEKKQIYNSKEEYIDNLNKLKMQAEKLEDEAKKEEQLIKINGGIKYNVQKCSKVSSLLYDSISTKLALLKQINYDINSNLKQKN